MTECPCAVEVISEGDIRSRVAELGEAMVGDYRGRDPIFVVILNGAFPFAADLARRFDPPCEIEFLALNRFGESGRIGISMDLMATVFERNVILVEEIVDTGLTLNVLRAMMRDRGAASVSAAALLDKTRRRVIDVPIEYRGFEVGDEFLLGYGLDWHGLYRNLRSIWAVLDLAPFVDDPKVLWRALRAH